MRDIEAMLQESQRNVNGTAILELRPLSFSTVGVESEDDLVKTKFGEYGEMQKGWTAEDAKGFIKVLSTPYSPNFVFTKSSSDSTPTVEKDNGRSSRIAVPFTLR